MARRRELPSALAHVDTSRSLPLRAELTVATIVIVLAVVLDLRNAIAVSGVAVLTYYALTNASVFTLAPDQRRWPLPIAAVGLVGCLVLIFSLPGDAVIGGIAVLAVGVVARAVAARSSPTDEAQPS